jgi:MmyB-like transcription regulator ligand binding domain
MTAVLGHGTCRERDHGQMSRDVGEPAWSELLDRLSTASARFRELWEEHEVSGVLSKTKRFLHPVEGLICLDHTVLRLADVPDVEVRVYTPHDDASRAAIERLGRR